MRKTFGQTTAFVAALCLAALCTLSCKFDDSKLWDAVGDLQERVDALEKASALLTEQISDLNDIILQIQQNNLVKSVELDENGDWLITFSSEKGDKVVKVVTEKEVEVTIPTLTVVKDGDKYYWAYLKGSETTFLTDRNSRKVPVSTTVEPKVRVNGDNLWEISVDSGNTWVTTTVSANGESTKTFFAGIAEDDDHLFITLADGSVLTLNKDAKLSFGFDIEEDTVRVPFGQTVKLNFHQSAVKAMVVLKPDGWQYSVQGKTLMLKAPQRENTFAETSGALTVIATDKNNDSVVVSIKVIAE